MPLTPFDNPTKELAARTRGLRVALVHDWLNGMRGGERVLEEVCRLFPSADLFTLIYDQSAVSPVIARMNVIESPFAGLPLARTHYRNFLPLMPRYISRLPTADYDLVLSTSHCVAKAAPGPRRGLHLSYVFSPMRYVWDHYEDYLSGKWWKDTALRLARGPMQRWDRKSCEQVDAFAADSAHIAEKIARFWGRKAEPIHPPVDLERFFSDDAPPDDFFLVVSALVPYKKVERAIEAAQLAKVKLVIVGGGPEEKRLRAMASKKYIKFAGKVPDSELPRYYQRARALLYPGVEDFGITALEAQACGRPVLAFGKGGVTETVIDKTSGVFFHDATAKSLARLLRAHDPDHYSGREIRRHAESFSPQAFRDSLAQWILRSARFLR